MALPHLRERAQKSATANERETTTTTHHDATHGDERRGGESPLLSSKQARDSDITTGPDLPVGLEGNSASKVVENERLVRLGESELPGESSVLDARPARGSGSSIVARDEDVIGLGLGDSGRDDSDADFRDELDGDASARVGALEVVDELEHEEGVSEKLRGSGRSSDSPA